MISNVAPPTSISLVLLSCCSPWPSLISLALSFTSAPLPIFPPFHRHPLLSQHQPPSVPLLPAHHQQPLCLLPCSRILPSSRPKTSFSITGILPSRKLH